MGKEVLEGCQPTWALAFSWHANLLGLWPSVGILSCSFNLGDCTSPPAMERWEGLECMHAGKSVYRYPGTVDPAVELPNSGCIKSLLDLLTSVDVFSLSRS